MGLTRVHKAMGIRTQKRLGSWGRLHGGGNELGWVVISKCKTENRGHTSVVSVDGPDDLGS